ncbi:Polyphosphate:AMP/ADP phosphotransferase [Geodia barretti]|uniref:Polyphosphate:AMP/ADP phosphotransferase n=2 Tax=Geodia barretti TaxID=519541 RepID=A0AA35T1W3_GEOBA|nr:Polyphosphate:AMP/ADP phosphotransferase [Geodia barretti]
MFELQNKLFAEGKQALLIVLQAMDAGGKDGTIRDVMQGFNPQGCRVVSFKAPNSVEAKHDFLWRIHRVVPAGGEIVIFNRSHYGDILSVSVYNLLPEERWSKRYKHINNFEKMLRDESVRTLKFYLHISKDEQKRRLAKRVTNPQKHWKFSSRDYEERKNWDKNMEAYEQVLGRCSTPWAPWYVVPADDKWYRNWVVGKIITDTLKDMDPKIPDASDQIHEFLDKM